MPELTLITIALIIGTAGMASFMHGAAGFGGALVSMPIYTAFLMIPLEMATPLQATHGVVMTSILFYRMRADADIRDAAGMILGSFIGLPVGIYLLRNVDAAYLLKPLGLLLVGQSIYSLFFAPAPKTDDAPDPHDAASRVGSWAAGFFGGLFGGAFAANGPPVVLYAVIRRWPKDHFRATLQPFFLASNATICAGLAAGGLLNASVMKLSLLALPGALAGLWLGFQVGSRINPEPFRKAVLVLVFLLGSTLLVR